MIVTVKAHFNKQTKDSKKELVQFYVKGDDEKKPELNELCREIVELEIDGIDPLTAEFVKKTQDSKKTVLEFIVKGDTSAAHSYEFYRKAGSDVELTISESQISIEEFHGEPDKGAEYSVNPDGTVDVKDEDQMTIDEVNEDKPDWQQGLDKESNVVNLDEKREQKASGFLDEEEDPEMQPLED